VLVGRIWVAEVMEMVGYGQVFQAHQPKYPISLGTQISDASDARVLAVNDVFYTLALIFLLLIPLVWLSRPKLAGSAGAVGGSGANADASAAAH
jgi:hypothetical protein